MIGVNVRFTQRHHNNFYLDQGQGHRILNLQDSVGMSSLRILSHFPRQSNIARLVSVAIGHIWS